MNLHPQADQIKQILSREGIQSLYHFTDINNLAIVAQCGGLWSKEKLEKAGLLDKVVTGGNELSLDLDKSLGNWPKVHLYFCPQTPMVYRVLERSQSHLCYIVIDMQVALWEGVFFTNTNATSNDHNRDMGMKGLKLVDFPTIKKALNNQFEPDKQKWHRNVQAEVLIPTEISLGHIRQIVFISEASLQEGERLWGSKVHPSFKVDENLFHKGFPFVEKCILTSQRVTKDNCAVSFKEEGVFRQSQAITFLVKLYATAGAELKIYWINSERLIVCKNTYQFESQGHYCWWFLIEATKLMKGNYCVKCYLSDICWARIPFEVV